jgi:hypothetical protein
LLLRSDRTARPPSLLPKPLPGLAQRIIAADADILEKMVTAVGELAEGFALPSAGSPNVETRWRMDGPRRAFWRPRVERRDGVTAEWDESGLHGHCCIISLAGLRKSRSVALSVAFAGTTFLLGAAHLADVADISEKMVIAFKRCFSLACLNFFHEVG